MALSQLALLLAGRLRDQQGQGGAPYAMPAAAVPPPAAAAAPGVPPAAVAPVVRAAPAAITDLSRMRGATMEPDAAAPPVPAANVVVPMATAEQARVPAASARQQGLESSISQYSKPTDPNDPAVKPRWWERVLGGAVGFGRGFAHDPNAMEEGASVTNRRFITAEYTRKQGLEGAQAQNEAFEKGEKLHNDQIDQELRRSQLDRQNRLTDAQIDNYDSEVKQRANKTDPFTQRRKEIDNAKSNGVKMTPEQEARYVLTGKLDSEFSQDDFDVNHTILKNTPPEKRGAKAESMFHEMHRRGNGEGGEKPETAATKLRRQNDLAKYDDQRQKELKALEHGDGKDMIGYKATLQHLKSSKVIPGTNQPMTDETRQKMIGDLNQAHAEEKQRIEDSYAGKVKGLGVDYTPVTYGADGSTTQVKPGANAKNGAENGAPPAAAFTKGEGVVHIFKNPTTGDKERWKLVNGKPQRAD